MNRFTSARGRGIITALIIFILAAAARMATGSAELRVSAELSHVHGDVSVMRTGGGEWIAAGDGTAVGAGTTVRTGPGASCVLTWGRGHALKLMESTTLRLDLLKVSPAAGFEAYNLYISQGKVYGRIRPVYSSGSVFEIRTPAAVAKFHGTRFAMGVDSRGNTEVEVTEGEAKVQDYQGDALLLKPGRKARIDKGEKPGPAERMTPAEIEAHETAEEVGKPLLEVHDPPGNMKTEKAEQAVRGRTAPGASVKVNGRDVPVDSNGFYTAKITLDNGANRIKVEAANKRGLSSMVSRLVIYVPPGEEFSQERMEEMAAAERAREKYGDVKLKIEQPREELLTRNEYEAVTGAVSPGSIVYINGEPAATYMDMPAFTRYVPLAEGENVVEAVSGNQRDVVTIVRDTTPPDLNVWLPYNLFESGVAGCTGPDDTLTCNVSGSMEPGAVLMINNRRFDTEADGSFSVWIDLVPMENAIVISATDAAGNTVTKVIERAFNPAKVVYLSVSVNPASMVADNLNTAVVTVTGMNLMGEPVTGTDVSLNATAGGTLSAGVVQLNGGTAQASFRAGVGSVRNMVTITASSGIVSTTTTLLLLPDVPPVFERKAGGN